MGQGLHTKVMQVAANALGVGMKVGAPRSSCGVSVWCV